MTDADDPRGSASEGHAGSEAEAEAAARAAEHQLERETRRAI